MSKKPKVAKPLSITTIQEINFQYIVDVDYQRETHCSSHGCHDEGICRCSTLEDMSISEINYARVISRIMTELNLAGNPLDTYQRYAIERLLRLNKCYETDGWTIDTSGGYYGEEIAGVHLEVTPATDIFNCLSLTSANEIVEFVLKAEYAKLLPVLENLNWSIETLSMNEITLGNKEYETMIKKEKHSPYKDYEEEIIGVVIPKHPYYRLIDGHHRFSSVNRATADFIVGRPK